MTLLQALQVAGLLAFALPSSSLARAAPGSGKIGRDHPTVIPRSFITSADRAYNLSSYTAPVKGSGSTTLSSTVKLTVDDTRSGHKQQITGYGAAVTDATVTVFSALSPENKNALLADLFTTDTPDGVGFSLMRHTIGASDLSSYEYSYDETVNDVLPDPTLSNFTLQDPGYKMVDMIAEFKRVNPDIKLLGSVWSPPGWMKLNHVMDGNATGNALNMTNAPSFAEYFVKYIQDFAKRGVDVDAITIQNEPLNSNPGYPTSYVSAKESTDLIQNYVGPALRRAGLKTQIWAYDHNTGTCCKIS
jgi:O-glycosyl hydrolase